MSASLKNLPVKVLGGSGVYLSEVHSSPMTHIPPPPFYTLYACVCTVHLSRRILRSSRPKEIFQPPQQGFYCTIYSVHAQLQLLGKIYQLFTTSPHLTSTLLTLAFVNNIILHLILVLCTAVNVRNKN
jgi:hypothetical protein